MNNNKQTLVTIVVVALCIHGVFGALARKQLAGPPSEFEQHRVPSPALGAMTSLSAEQPFYVDVVRADESAQEVMGAKEFVAGFEQKLVCDSTDQFLFTVFSPHEESLVLKLVDPNGAEVNLGAIAQATEFPLSDSNGAAVKGTAYVLEKPVLGEYVLTAHWGGEDHRMNLAEVMALRETLRKTGGSETAPHGVVFVRNEAQETLHTQMQSYRLVKGQTIGVKTRAFDSATFDDSVRVAAVPEALKDAVTAAEMDVLMPDGHEVDVPMHDDGLHGDELSNDGVFGAQIEASEVGDYVLTTVVKGTNNAGAAFKRTTQQLVRVVADTLSLTGESWAAMKEGSNRVMVYLGVQEKVPAGKAVTYRAYAEVYGQSTTDSSSEVAACWVSALVDVERVQGKAALGLEVDVAWLERAKVKAPLRVKNVYVTEVEAHVPLSEESEMSVSMELAEELKLAEALVSVEFDGVRPITREMREGVRPARNVSLVAAGKKGLVLSHGYCSAENPWEAQKELWTDAAFFLNPSASETNDRFAQLLGEFGDSKFESYGVIGHSQGGLAALHLHNYYFSGLEESSNGRQLQSLGSPYYGCSGAGSAANLIKVFGVGCGANTDLTTDGAALWNAGITGESRKDVYFYTTQYKTGGLVNYCNLATNLVLKWPNDGTTELKFSQLADGHNMGHTKGQCHTQKMKWAPQYWDKSRNAVLNSEAAR